jgi:hypothetical protein
MKVLFLLMPICLSISASTFAGELKCNASKGKDSVEVQPEITQGTAIPQRNSIMYKGHKVSVLFTKADEYDTNDRLFMRLGDAKSEVRYPSKKSVYVLESKRGPALTCYFERTK